MTNVLPPLTDDLDQCRKCGAEDTQSAEGEYVLFVAATDTEPEHLKFHCSVCGANWRTLTRDALHDVPDNKGPGKIRVEQRTDGTVTTRPVD